MAKLKKILVVGASIAGPAVCYWLKRFGFSPTIIEINPTIRKGGFAIDIRGIAIDLLKKMEIYKSICDKRTKITLGRYVDAQGNVLHEEQGELYGFREGEDVEIVRGHLVELLMHTIPEIPCYFNQQVKQLVQHDDFVELVFKDGKKEKFDIVIGADGLHSSIRSMAFNNEEYSLKHLGAYFSVFGIPNYLNLNRIDVAYEANQKSIHINSDEDPNLSQAGLMFRSIHLLKNIRDEREQKNFLKNTFWDMGWESNKLLQLMETTKDFYFDSITQVKMNFWTKGRVALVGDAGYCASPLSGQGTSLALVGAYILAGELNNAGENYKKAFSNYNRQLRPFVEENQRLGEWVSKTYLVTDESSKEIVEKRTAEVLHRLKIAANAIILPEYNMV
jgi:2-polyprenyl-6-methoxyphenol hydroxylase-like FAD-dependent oxidoreductase